MTVEDWRLIPGYPDYWVSSLGRVVSRRRRRERELHPSRNQRGYHMVHLRAPDGTKMLRTVHRLVAEAFLGPIPDGLQTCHADGDMDNNAVSNLRYDTPSANMLDQVRHGRHNNASKTHCPQNHPYDEANTWHYRGRRHCIACARARPSYRRALAT